MKNVADNEVVTEEIRNTTITSHSLTTADHNTLFMYLNLEYGDQSVQSFGGHGLYSDDWKGYDPNDFCGKYICEVLKVVGVRDIKSVVGKNIRVFIKDGLITKIGHITKDIWFDPEECFEKQQEIVNERRKIARKAQSSIGQC